jgi:hypothetical protein
MKKALCIPILLVFLACGKNDRGNVPSEAESSTPSAIDTAQHPNGMSNGSVISRDTAAMQVDSTARP